MILCVLHHFRKGKMCIRDRNKDLESIDASEIKQIELTGTTGGKDGNYSYFFSDKEVVEFIDLLNLSLIHI